MRIELSKQDAEHLIAMLNTVKIEGIKSNAIFMHIIHSIQKAFAQELNKRNEQQTKTPVEKGKNFTMERTNNKDKA